MPYDIQFRFQYLAVAASICLVAFLSYASQLFLFPHLEPCPLDRRQVWKLNLLAGATWVSYFRAVTVHPGRVPAQTDTDVPENQVSNSGTSRGPGATGVKNVKAPARQRYCRKCQSVKPPRAHHCKICQRCIPKMDHHCPWTANCVSHFTFPHFFRFLVYSLSTGYYLEYLFYIRASTLWQDRDLPSYLGPSVLQLVLLVILISINTISLFVVSIIFLRTSYDMLNNMTTIETWEIERHSQLLRRSRALGGYLDGPDGLRIRITKQEFPYDIGLWSNVVQAMGTSNPLLWLWPFARTRKDTGVTFETNGFEDPAIGWPPPDPDRMPRLQRKSQAEDASAFVHGDIQALNAASQLNAFRQRQADDLRRRQMYSHDDMSPSARVLRRKPFHARYDVVSAQPKQNIDLESEDEGSGEEGWQDSNGSRLKDYGIDEDAEFYDEDEVPLAELMRRRRLAA